MRLGELVAGMRKLQSLKINLDSWAYFNDNITSQGLVKFLKQFQQMAQLKKLYLNLNHWGRRKEVINDQVLEHLSAALGALQNLESAALLMKRDRTATMFVSQKSMNRFFKSIYQIKKLIKFNLDISYWDQSDSVLQNNYFKIFMEYSRQLYQIQSYKINLTGFNQSQDQNSYDSFDSIFSSNNLRVLVINFSGQSESSRIEFDPSFFNYLERTVSHFNSIKTLKLEMNNIGQLMKDQQLQPFF